MGWLTAIGGLLRPVLGFFSNKDELRTVRFKLVIEAAKARVSPRAVGGWVCVLAVLGALLLDIVQNEGENLDALSALLIVALGI